MKKIILATALVFTCSNVLAATFTASSPISKTNGTATFVVQPGDTCQGLGTYIQTHQCANKIISFIAYSASGQPTMCVWNSGWKNGQRPPMAGATGYYHC